MNKKSLFLALSVLSIQPVFAARKVTLSLDERIIQKMEVTVDDVQRIHKANIDLLKPFSDERTHKQDERIEKEMHHRVRKMSRDPGFLKSFFATELAEQDVRCPFLWYFRQIGKAIGKVRAQRRKAKKRLRQLERAVASHKTSAADVKNAAEFIKDIKDLEQRLETLQGELVLLRKFIRESEAFTRESQSQPSAAAEPKSHFGNICDALSSRSRHCCKR